jgi:hypothetical protein
VLRASYSLEFQILQNEPNFLTSSQSVGCKIPLAVGFEFIDENGGGPGVRLRKPLNFQNEANFLTDFNSLVEIPPSSSTRTAADQACASEAAEAEALRTGNLLANPGGTNGQQMNQTIWRYRRKAVVAFILDVERIARETPESRMRDGLAAGLVRC